MAVKPMDERWYVIPLAGSNPAAASRRITYEEMANNDSI
jgi:hypothetical protein